MDNVQSVTYVMFLIFAGTAILSTMALFTQQSLLVAYIALGWVFGPWGLGLVSNSEMIKQVGDIGIIFLLFLLGLHLQPQNLYHSIKKMSFLTFVSSIIFFSLGYLASYFSGYNTTESIIIGITAMFSSTIIGIKLLPTTILHHQHTGELVVSILLLQDIIAIGAILSIEIFAERSASLTQLGSIIISFPVLLSVAYIFQRYFLSKLLERFDKVHEYIFILSVGWCLSMAQLSHYLGLSDEIGAFIAGVSLASNPIAFYIAENLKPLRDFFLVIFFFSIGAGFNFNYLPQVFLPALFLACLLLLVKPAIFGWLLYRSGEVKKVSWEIGVRLGQMSEFSLLLIYVATQANLISETSSHMVEAATIITFIVSCYWTVLKYPTPLAVIDKLRRD